MRTTIKDVAKYANVSTATVSYVIHNKKEISSEVKERIFDAMKKLNYKPNVNAQSLKTNKTKKIGLVVPDITNPFFSSIVKNIGERLQANDYQLILVNSDYNSKGELSICHSFIYGGGVDALILLAPRMSDRNLQSCGSDFPVFVVDRPAPKKNDNVLYVYSDNYMGATFVAENFWIRGYRQFACIAGPSIVPNANLRLNGFVDRLLSYGVQKESIIIERGEFTFQDGFSCMESILRKAGASPEHLGIFVCSDISAWGAMEAVRQKGLRVPEDIGITGYDDIFLAQFLNPALTTIHTPSVEMGKIVATSVLEYLESGRLSSCNSIVLGSTLVERRSV